MENTRGQPHLFRRYLLLLAGLTVMAFGIAFAVRSDLGTTSISSLPYVLSLTTPLTLGTHTILMNAAFLLAQVLILRRRFPPLQVLQLPVVLLFGLLNDVAVWLLRDLSYSAYWQQWVLGLIGITCVGIGVACSVTSQTVMLSGDALVLTITNELTRWLGARRYLVFGYAKMVFDSLLVLSAAVLSAMALHELVGVREGTVAAALLIGMVAKQVIPLLKPLQRRWLD
ncbi:YczE/YyaS/YitT family protein [Corynebacterium halotolerans]|uniref:YczE/YyaS/YitT family protein n=1 Tax=Corynebacterium halotolerans TaxID=225326 RepID=UPI003CF3FBFA